jgi:hypothetical protein
MLLLSLLSLSGSVLAVTSGAATTDSDSAHLNVVPYPSDVSLGSGATTLDPKFSIDIADCTVDCDILKRAVDRYMGIIFQPVGSTGTVFRQTIFEDRINASTPEGLMEPLRQLKVMTTGKESVDLQLGVEESYFLEVSAGADQVTDTNIQTSFLFFCYTTYIVTLPLDIH